MTLEGNPWFVAADVCRVLELGWDKANQLYAPSRVVKHLDGTEVSSNLIAMDGRRRYMLCISESGLYKLAMRSDKPQAKPFQDWVTKEVLPSIRKTGAYVAGQMSLMEHPKMTPLELMMDQFGKFSEAMCNVVKSQAAEIADLRQVNTALLGRVVALEQKPAQAAYQVLPAAPKEDPDNEYITAAFFAATDMMLPKARFDVVSALGGSSGLRSLRSKLGTENNPKYLLREVHF